MDPFEAVEQVAQNAPKVVQAVKSLSGGSETGQQGGSVPVTAPQNLGSIDFGLPMNPAVLVARRAARFNILLNQGLF